MIIAQHDDRWCAGGEETSGAVLLLFQRAMDQAVELINKSRAEANTATLFLAALLDWAGDDNN